MNAIKSLAHHLIIAKNLSDCFDKSHLVFCKLLHLVRFVVSLANYNKGHFLLPQTIELFFELLKRGVIPNAPNSSVRIIGVVTE